MLRNNRKNNDKPKTARPATPSPMTVPPPKDTCRALGKLSRAACVVRALASVAIRIPIFPARAEKIAPTTNAGMIRMLVVSTILEITNSPPEAIKTKINNNLHKVCH